MPTISRRPRLWELGEAGHCLVPGGVSRGLTARPHLHDVPVGEAATGTDWCLGRSVRKSRVCKEDGQSVRKPISKLSDDTVAGGAAEPVEGGWAVRTDPW